MEVGREERSWVLQLLPPLMGDVTNWASIQCGHQWILSNCLATSSDFSCGRKHLSDGSLFTDVSLQLVLSVSNCSAV